jgi:predicted ATP-grasp superfamily ATP-dependent carboligase
MKNIFIATTLISTLSSCAITPTSSEQSHYKLNSPTQNTYSIAVEKIDNKHVLFMKRPGSNNSYRVFESKGQIQQPLISTSGEFITYISFERSIPALFIQEAATGRRIMVCFLEDQEIRTKIAVNSSRLTVSSKGSDYSLLLVEPSLLDLTLPRESLPFCSSKSPSEVP